jgi:actin-related protein 6
MLWILSSGVGAAVELVGRKVYNLVAVMSVVIIDNGAGKIKAGLAPSKPLAHSPATMQVKSSNCIARMNKQMNILVADEVDSCLNGSLLHYTRPFERGYLTNWQSETEVWSRVFGNKGLKINTAESILCTTEAPFTPEPLQNDMNEVVFEEFGFQSCLRRPAAWFSANEFAASTTNGTTSGSSCTVVDSGFSFTYSMPFIDGKCRKSACKRVNVGGKLLTNFLKEVVSYRQWNMMDEFKIIDQVSASRL